MAPWRRVPSHLARIGATFNGFLLRSNSRCPHSGPLSGPAARRRLDTADTTGSIPVLPTGSIPVPPTNLGSSEGHQELPEAKNPDNSGN
jgi:hypothetical protein